MAEDGAPATLDEDVAAMMDSLLDKLELLNYYREFCVSRGLKPLNRVYFAVQQGGLMEQWLYFTQLCSWLMSLNNLMFQPPTEGDDPNAAAANLVSQLKKLGVEGDFSPAKLKPGWGAPVCFVLNALVDRTLYAVGFKFKRPHIPSDDRADEAVVDDMEVKNEEVADDVGSCSDEETSYMDRAAAAPAGRAAGGARAEAPVVEPPRPRVDPKEWKMQLERVAPLLKVRMAADNKDWRTHIEQMKTHQKAIAESFADTSANLTRMGGDITKTLEKIQSREKYVNSQLTGLIQEFQHVQDNYLTSKERAQRTSDSVTALQNELHTITEELDSLKTDMEERADGMKNTSAVSRIKQAVTDLKEEIKQMELRIGIVQAALLQHRLQEKKDLASRQKKGAEAGA